MIEFMRILSFAVLAGTPFLLAPAPVKAQRTDVRVTVRDSLSGLPLGGVSIRADVAKSPIALTDSSGTAVARMDSSTHRLFFNRIGYLPTDRLLLQGDDSRVHLVVTMVRTSVAIEGVAVEAKWIDLPPRLREFEERREGGRGGVYFTREQIVKRNTNRLTDLLRGISSVRIVESAGVKAVASTRSVIPRKNNSGNLELRYCLLRVVIDGIPKEVGFPLDALEPNEIHGIEVYSGPGTVPSQYAAFGRDANCGVILLWTR